MIVGTGGWRSACQLSGRKATQIDPGFYHLCQPALSTLAAALEPADDVTWKTIDALAQNVTQASIKATRSRPARIVGTKIGLRRALDFLAIAPRLAEPRCHQGKSCWGRAVWRRRACTGAGNAAKTCDAARSFHDKGGIVLFA